MTTDELQKNPAYHLLLMLPHDDLIPFLQEQISGKSRMMATYLLFNVAILLSMAAIAFFDIRAEAIGWNGILKSFGLGTLLVFTIMIAVHEVIHGIAYKMMGAPRVSFGVNWRKFYFYAVADKFIVNRKSFFFIALAPFVVISLLAIGGLFFAGIELKWVLLSVLFVHTGACAGDFAMLAFYEKHRRLGEILTFDDVERKISYFYLKD